MAPESAATEEQMNAVQTARPGRIFSKPRIGFNVPADQAGTVYSILGNGGSLSRLYSGYEERQQQLDLSAFVEGCIRDREHGAGEAGTGVGKSYGYLVPAILSGRKTLIAVPTNALLTQLITKDLPALSQPGAVPRRFTFSELKGRGNYVCPFKADRFAADPTFESKDDARAWPAVAEWIEQSTDGDLGKVNIPLPMAIRSEITSTSDECLGESCPDYGRCPAEAAKLAAVGADVIVTNLTMLMLDLDLRHASGGIASVLPDRELVIIDEAHDLRERAVSAATSEITFGSFERMAVQVENLCRRAEQAAQQDFDILQAREMLRAIEEDREPVSIGRPQVVERWEPVIRQIRRSLRDLFDGFRLRMTEAKRSAMRLGDELDIVADLLMAIDGLGNDLLSGCPSYLDDGDRKAWEKLAARIVGYGDGLGACLTLKRGSSANVVRFVQMDADGEKITFAHAPVDVAPWLRDRLWTASMIKPVQNEDGTYDRTVCLPVTTVAVSATIVDDRGTLDYFRETVGLDRCREIVVGSPFNYAENGLLYVPADPRFDSSVARKDKETWKAYLDLLTDEYERLIRTSGGRAFCLFTANSTLDHVYNRLSERDLPFLLLRQGEYAQPETIRRFKESGRAVLFGVKSYWAGVDVQGAALSCVIISGIPFTPPDDPMYEARCLLADRRYGGRASFQKISIPEATTALKQGFGRGIRSSTDTAAVCILDYRLLGRKYGPGILAAMPPSPVVSSHDAVEAFFDRVGR